MGISIGDRLYFLSSTNFEKMETRKQAKSIIPDEVTDISLIELAALKFPKATEEISILDNLRAVMGSVHISEEEIESDDRLKYLLSKVPKKSDE